MADLAFNDRHVFLPVFLSSFPAIRPSPPRPSHALASLSTILHQHLCDLYVPFRGSGLESVAIVATLCIDICTLLHQLGGEPGNASWCMFKVAPRLVNPCTVRDGARRVQGPGNRGRRLRRNRRGCPGLRRECFGLWRRAGCRGWSAAGPVEQPRPARRYSCRTPTEAIFPSTWEGNRHLMEKTGLLIWRPFGQPYGLQWPQAGLTRTNRRPTKAPKTPNPPYPTEPTPLTSCHGQQAPPQPPKIGR